MKNRQRLITALVTIVAATATAHLMQRNSQAEARIGDAPPQVQAASVLPVATPEARATVADKPDEPAPAPGIEANESTPPAAATATAAETAGTETAQVENRIAALDLDASAIAEPPVERPVRLAAATTASDPSPGRSLKQVPDMPRPPKDALAPAPLPATGAGLAERMAASGATIKAKPAEASAPSRRNEFGLTCGLILSASEQPGAMVKLTLTAPCRGEEAVTVRHGDLTFSGQLTHLGGYSVLVPALVDDAEFTVTFSDGETTSTQLTVPGAQTVERVVLQTEGETGLQIHALEFGADYDTPGHVWAGQPRDARTAIKIGGGFIAQLGDPALDDPHMAEVYTFPPDARIRDGVVRLSIEAEVTAYNCAKDIAGQTMQRQADGSMKAVTVTLAMPDCEAIGEFLVLKNLLQDLKIASN